MPVILLLYIAVPLVSAQNEVYVLHPPANWFLAIFTSSTVLSDSTEPVAVLSGVAKPHNHFLQNAGDGRSRCRLRDEFVRSFYWYTGVRNLRYS